MKTSNREIIDIIKAWLAISVAFGIVLGGLSSGFLRTFILAAITVGIGFLLHELAHKLVAQRYGYFAEFRSFDQMLILAIVMSFFGFIFAAPGAVMISGIISRRKNGIISVAGPITNIILAIIFIFLTKITSGFLLEVSTFGALINTWLALFNMIPIWNLDGKKVWSWNKAIFFSVVVVALGLFFIP